MTDVSSSASQGSVFWSRGLASLLLALPVHSPPSPSRPVTLRADLCVSCLWLPMRFSHCGSRQEMGGQEQRWDGGCPPLAPSLWGQQGLADPSIKDVLSGGHPQTAPLLQVAVTPLSSCPSNLTQRCYQTEHCIWGPPHSDYLSENGPFMKLP